MLFLDQGKKYTAHVYVDDPNVETRTHVRIDQKEVNSTKTLDIELAPRCGQAVHIVPAS